MVASSELTAREVALLKLMAEGLVAKESAQVLGLTERTVMGRIGIIRNKLGALNAAHAVHLGWQLGYLPASGGAEHAH